ncbi:MAG: hypothetical protein IH795_10190 [Bacteroidetes bacterium]|nr:hypothetical protein [Bacteroidota bacterium]
MPEAIQVKGDIIGALGQQDSWFSYDMGKAQLVKHVGVSSSNIGDNEFGLE